MGGLLALEAAQQFQSKGEKVPFLAMFDTFGPKYIQTIPNVALGYLSRFKLLNKLLNFIKNLLAINNKSRINYLKQSFSFHINTLFRLILFKVYRLSAKPLPHFLRYWYIEKRNLEIMAKYVPKSYNGEIILFRASDKKDDKNFDPINGWDGMATNGIRVIEVPGSHINIVEQPLLGEKLSLSLREVQDRK